MSLDPELFRALADARGLPSGEEDWNAWQKAYEALEDVLAALEDEELDRQEPALVFLHTESVPTSSGPTRLEGERDTGDDELSALSLAAAADLIRRRRLSPVELVRAVLDRIEANGKAINAYIACYPEEALQQARKAEDVLGQGRPVGPLHGIPLGTTSNPRSQKANA